MKSSEKLSAEATLLALIDETISALEELQARENEDGGPTNQYIEGAKDAYVTCLEYLQRWERAEACGLDFDIEEIFPV